mmetsp:Transcript_4735/g.6898  ORF Transcript_4735/g.6898 Transcript_4735/m.6898 type:complete len:284 (-) Transcript_4735:450-1301(-)
MGNATSACDVPSQNDHTATDLVNANGLIAAEDCTYKKGDGTKNSEREHDSPEFSRKADEFDFAFDEGNLSKEHIQRLEEKSMSNRSSTDGPKHDSKSSSAGRRNKKRKRVVSRGFDCFEKDDDDDPLIRRSVAKFYSDENGVKRIYFGSIVSAGSIGEYEMYRIAYSDDDDEYAMKEDICEMLQVYQENKEKYVHMQVVETYPMHLTKHHRTQEMTVKKELNKLCQDAKKLKAKTEEVQARVRKFKSKFKSGIKNMKSELRDLMDTMQQARENQITHKAPDSV